MRNHRCFFVVKMRVYRAKNYIRILSSKSNISEIFVTFHAPPGSCCDDVFKGGDAYEGVMQISVFEKPKGG